MKMVLMMTVAILFVTGSAAAQFEVANPLPADQVDLLREVEPQPPTYAINSAIVLTNPHNVRVEFKIQLYDNDGSPAGSGEAVVGPRQLKVIWVSQLLDDQTRRFVGWGEAKTSRALKTSAFLAGIGVSPLPVETQRVRNTDVASRHKLFSVRAAL
jgi:hypothetical protein